MRWIAGDILTALVALGGEADLAALAGQARLEHKQTGESCAVLVKLGFVERIGTGRYQLTEAGKLALEQGRPMRSGPKGDMPKQQSRGLRQLAWRAIRMERKFTLPELQALICDGTEKDAYANLQQYVQFLARAGHLILLPHKAPGGSPSSNGHNRYLLDQTMDTGPLAPVYRKKTQHAYDPNTGKAWSIERRAGQRAACTGVPT